MTLTYGPDEEWAKPAGPSALGNWWRETVGNYNRYGTATPGNSLPTPDFIAGNQSALPSSSMFRNANYNATGLRAVTPPTQAPTLPSPNAYTPQQMASSVPPDRLPGMQQASARYDLGQQGYSPVANTDFMRRSADGAITYQQPGIAGLGGMGPGSATFQGLPGQGPFAFGIDTSQAGRITQPQGSLGYAGTAETAGMTQRQATDYNVANLNRQIDSLRSLREARNPGITSGTNQGAFGDLVSFGTPGGNFGDEAMRAEHIRGALNQAISGRGLSRNQRQGMIEGAQALAGLPQSPGVTRMAPSGLSAIDPYKMGQLQLDAQRLDLDQQRWQTEQQRQASLSDFERQKWQTEQQRNQALDDSLIRYRQDEGQPKPMGLDQMKANMLNGYNMAHLVLSDPQTPKEERARAQQYVDLMNSQLNPDPKNLDNTRSALPSLLGLRQPSMY